MEKRYEKGVSDKKRERETPVDDYRIILGVCENRGKEETIRVKLGGTVYNGPNCNKGLCLFGPINVYDKLNLIINKFDRLIIYKIIK